MHQEIEIEFKNMLTFEEYANIKEHFQLQASDFIEQENFYFDTPTLSLAQSASALRIRLKNGAYELTFKKPHEDGLLESTSQLNKDEALAFIKQNTFPPSASRIKALLLPLIQPPELLCLGSLTTKRAEWKYHDGFIALDHSRYLDVEDYEIEYEVQNEKKGWKRFSHLLHVLKIPKRETKNKLERFLNEKRKRRV